MARIRTIKPEFWTSEQVMELSPTARLAFIGMWNFCDDQGVHPASSKTLKAEVFPSDDISSAEVQVMVDQMIEHSLIRVFESAGKSYWWVTGWNHQKIDKPTCKYPAPDFSSSNQQTIVESSPSPRRVLAESSPPEGKGRVEEVNPLSLRDSPPSSGKKPKAKGVTFSTWLADVKAKGEKAVSDHKPLWDYCEKVGIPADWIEIAWARFSDRYKTDEKAKRKLYADWRRVFLRAVEENWLGLWFFSEREQAFRLSTTGVAADLSSREVA